VTQKYTFYGERDETKSVKGIKVYHETGRVTIGWFRKEKAQGYARDVRGEQDANEGFFVNGKASGYNQMMRGVSSNGGRGTKWIKVENKGKQSYH